MLANNNAYTMNQLYSQQKSYGIRNIQELSNKCNTAKIGMSLAKAFTDLL